MVPSCGWAVLQVTVEYHPDDVDSFIQLADAFEDAFPDLQVVGSEVSDAKHGHLAIKNAAGEVLRALKAAEALSEADIAAIVETGGYATSQ